MYRQTMVKKVVIFADFFSSLGGTEYYNFMLAIMLKKRGIDVRIYIGECPQHTYWSKLLDENSISYRYPDKFHDNLQDRLIEKEFLAQIKNEIEKWNPDIIHANPPGKMLVSWFELTIDAIPVIATEWTMPAENTAHWYPEVLHHYIHRINTFIATCNQCVQGIQKLHKYQKPIAIVPHLISPPMSKEYPYRDNLQSFGCISRLSPEKGLYYLLAAWQKINRRYHGSCLHIYGHGKEEASLKELVCALNLSKCIIFEGTYDPIWGIDRIAEKHSVFIQPSLFESIPTAIIELMGRGKILVATNVGGVSEIIHPEYNNGLLIESASTESIVEGIKGVFELSSEERSVISGNATKIFRNNYNVEENVDRIIDVYLSCMNTRLANLIHPIKEF